MTEELNDLVRSMDLKLTNFTRDVNKIKDHLNEIDQRLDKSEQTASANEIHEEHVHDTARSRQLGAVNRIADLGPTEDIQVEFKNVKDSVQTVTLPPDIRLLAEKAGIKREEQSKLNIITKCAQYSETILKLLKDNRVEETELFTVAVAQQKYLQDEYSNEYSNEY